MEFVNIETKNNISGWGVDANKSVRPNYPMWKIPENGTGAHWAVPEQQPGFNDFYSIERPGPTHVFGNTVKPKWLSGIIRKKAFKYSESAWEHWMMLIFADRVSVYEGIIDDILHGYRPKLLIERGWRVDKKFKTRRYKKVRSYSALALLIPVGLFLLKASSSKEVPRGKAYR